jgi:hypothetical protein
MTMRLTRILVALTFISLAGAAHADGPFIKGNQVDDFTQPQQSALFNVAQKPAPAPKVDGANLPACCTGFHAAVDAPASDSGAGHFDGESKG